MRSRRKGTMWRKTHQEAAQAHFLDAIGCVILSKLLNNPGPQFALLGKKK